MRAQLRTCQSISGGEGGGMDFEGEIAQESMSA